MANQNKPLFIGNTDADVVDIEKAKRLLKELTGVEYNSLVLPAGWTYSENADGTKEITRARITED